MIFFRNRKGRLLFLNSIPTLLIGLPLMASLSGIRFPVTTGASAMGYFIIPITLIYLITDYYPLEKRKHIVMWSAAVSAGIPASLLFPQITKEILFVYQISAFLYLLFILRERLLTKINITLLLVVSPAVLSLFYFFIQGEYSLAAALIIIYLLTNIFLLYEYSKRAEIINQRITSITALNKRLDQVITRQKQNNDQLKKIIAQKDVELLQIARHASLAEITTGIAHELAQPLTGIKCISQSIIDDINYDELDLMQAVSDLSKISSLVDRSSSIIDHIRTFSRKRGFSFQPADLNACILNAVELVNNQIRNSRIDIEFTLDESIPGIYGDNLSLEQLFINLILNSRDAINARGENCQEYAGKIKIMTGANEENAWLIIEDNGSGIPEDIIPKIWTPFFTTKRKGKGTGIGLSLSHRIIREHNAEVSVDSSGNGTLFTITFPLAQTVSTSETNL
jgi:C4-dicarboxylate-specific signal transduction histidine kinase